MRLSPTTCAIARTLKHIWPKENNKPRRFANGLKANKEIWQTCENACWHPGKASTKAKMQEFVIDVSEEEYQTDLMRGLQEDEVLKPGRHRFKRGGFLARHGLHTNETNGDAKVRVLINLDLDVLNYFKQQAARPNAPSYQTQINNILREVMEKEQKFGK